jgi:hypothetical protein
MDDDAFHHLFLFIQIENFLWNQVFHLGSPDGKAFYQFFFLFWPVATYGTW